MNRVHIIKKMRTTEMFCGDKWSSPSPLNEVWIFPQQSNVPQREGNVLCEECQKYLKLFRRYAERYRQKKSRKFKLLIYK